MTANHLPADIARCGMPFRAAAFHGVGFRLGVSGMLAPVAAQVLTQLTPDWMLPRRRGLRALAYKL